MTHFPVELQESLHATFPKTLLLQEVRTEYLEATKVSTLVIEIILHSTPLPDVLLQTALTVTNSRFRQLFNFAHPVVAAPRSVIASNPSSNDCQMRRQNAALLGTS